MQLKALIAATLGLSFLAPASAALSQQFDGSAFRVAQADPKADEKEKGKSRQERGGDAKAKDAAKSAPEKAKDTATPAAKAPPARQESKQEAKPEAKQAPKQETDRGSRDTRARDGDDTKSRTTQDRAKQPEQTQDRSKQPSSQQQTQDRAKQPEQTQERSKQPSSQQQTQDRAKQPSTQQQQQGRDRDDDRRDTSRERRDDDKRDARDRDNDRRDTSRERRDDDRERSRNWAREREQRRTSVEELSRTEIRGDRTITIDGGSRMLRRDGDRVVIRGYDFDRLSHGRNGRGDTRVERMPNGFTRTIVLYPDGTQIVTVTGTRGDIVQRFRRDRGGREVYFIREVRRPPLAQINLGPLRLTIPREEYIVDNRRASPQQIRAALIAPPVEPVERV
jgi:hypothetical protein